jgi:hypothetical protein
MRNTAEMFFECLTNIRNDGNEQIIGNSYDYWNDAMMNGGIK